MKASRSFHVGNLSLRDMLPVISGSIGETFDLNKVSDKAYQPRNLVYRRHIYDLFTKPPSPDILTTKAPVPDNLPSWLNWLGSLVKDAQEISGNLSWFRMYINQHLGIGEFTTFTEKCSNQSEILIPIVEKITGYYAQNDTKKLLNLRSRYIGPRGDMRDVIRREGDSLIYRESRISEKKIAIEELASKGFAFLKNIADLSFSRGTKEDLEIKRKEMEWPIFSNEMNGLCSYVYDHIVNGEAEEQLHLGGQAMYNYVENNSYKEVFGELLTIAQQSPNITEKMLQSWFGVIPVQFYRFIGYEEDLLANIQTLFTLDSNSKNLIQERTIAYKQFQDTQHNEVVKATNAMKNNKEDIAKLLASISTHPEIISIPAQTIRDGTLNQLYHSQLDLMDKISNGFDPHAKRWFFMNKSAGEIQTVLNIPLQKIL